MASRAAEKMIDALTQLLEGFNELHEGIEETYTEKEDEDEDEEEESEGNVEMENALVAEVKSALEAVIEGEDYAPEEIATLISAITEALQEIEPDLFEDEEATPAGIGDVVEDLEDDDDIELDDDEEFDYDEDEDEEEEDEEEEEDADDDLDDEDLDDEDLDDEEEEE